MTIGSSKKAFCVKRGLRVSYVSRWLIPLRGSATDFSQCGDLRIYPRGSMNISLEKVSLQ